MPRWRRRRSRLPRPSALATALSSGSPNTPPPQVSPVMDGVLSDGTSFGVMAFQVRLCPPPGAAAAACVAASAFAPLPPKYANEPLGSHLTSAAVGGVLQLLSLLTVAAFVALAAVRARDETMLGRIHSACELRAGIVVPGVGILASLLCVVGALFVVANTDGGDRNPSDSTGPGFNLAMSAFCMIGCAVVCTAAGSHEIAGVRYQRRREAEAAWQRSRRSSRGSSTAAVLAAVDGARAPTALAVRAASRGKSGIVGTDNPARSHRV